MSLELNEKFKLHSKVIPHKKVYWVILIPREDVVLLNHLIKPFMHPCISYKLPKV